MTRMGDQLPWDELRRLRFNEPRESQFRHYYYGRHLRRDSSYLRFGLLFFWLFVIPDVLLLEHYQWQVMGIRLGVVVLLIGLLYVMALPWGRRFVMGLEVFGLVTINLAVVLIGYLAVRDGVVEYQSATLLVILFAAALSRLTFRLCALTIGLALLSYSLLLLLPETLAARNFTINNLTLCLAITILSLMTSYQREFETRREFVHTRMLEEKHQQLQAAQARLSYLSLRDPLTDLYNRRYFEEIFSRQGQLCSRAGASLSLLLFDIDQLEQFRQQRGHVAADEALRDLGLMFAAHARRKEDFAARLGEENFALVLPLMAFDDAVRVAEQLRRRTEDMALGEQLPLTISMGVASAELQRDQDGVALATLRERAELALKQAREQGGNRLVAHHETQPQRSGETAC